MPTYSNGRVPRARLIKIASGTDRNGYWEHQLPASTLRKWNAALDYARRKWSKVMRISTGWNGYRPYEVQVDARSRACASGNCNAAARAGWSSHGGTWVSAKYTGGRWVDAMAIDVVPQQLTWAQVDEAMRHAGFLVGAITKAIAGMDEPWHYIDLDPWAAVPSADLESKPFTPAPDEEVLDLSEEDDMLILIKRDGKNEWSLLDPDAGPDLPRLTGSAERKHFRAEKTPKGVVNTFRGFYVTTDPDVAAAWGRSYARQYGNAPQNRVEGDYQRAQLEASRLSAEKHRA